MKLDVGVNPLDLLVLQLTDPDLDPQERFMKVVEIQMALAKSMGGLKVETDTIREVALRRIGLDMPELPKAFMDGLLPQVAALVASPQRAVKHGEEELLLKTMVYCATRLGEMGVLGVPASDDGKDGSTTLRENFSKPVVPPHEYFSKGPLVVDTGEMPGAYPEKGLVRGEMPGAYTDELKRDYIIREIPLKEGNIILEKDLKRHSFAEEPRGKLIPGDDK